MPERRSVDFDQVSFNVISDPERSTITLQFPSFGGGSTSRESVATKQILKAITARYGMGLKGQLIRWKLGTNSPLLLPSQNKPHPDAPDVLCFEMGVRPGERMDLVLADFLAFLSQRPG